ncbi:MAG TPA: PEGA domain-containing protein [Polyangiaceae bacterium]|nr:PEGA domain-containing protein [Polyangiaceae bacterium]
MTRRSLALVFALVTAASLPPSVARAQAPTQPNDAARAEARDRFDRGLRMFNAGDNSGALAEFLRAYEITGNVVVLYNLGLVYAQMGRAAEATDALDRVLGSPGALSPERQALAKRTRDEQAARIAEVIVTTSVDGAAIEVDGVEVGKTPLAQPLRVTSGSHVVGASAPGYSPQRKEVTIASGEKQSVAIDLVPTQARLAHLAVKTHVPGADLFVDNQRIGVTPLAASIPLDPGVHAVELRRAGYKTAGTSVALGNGASGEVSLDPEEDPSASARDAGLLSLDMTETQAVVTIDGRSRGVYGAALRLPSGPHHLLVERGNFEPVERDVAVAPGQTAVVRVALEPTPEYRAQFVSRTTAQRTYGWIATVGGAVILGGGIGLVAYDAGQRSHYGGIVGSFNLQSGTHSGQVCDPAQDFTTYQQNCLVPKAAAQSKVDDANMRDYFGWSAVGVGGAAIVVGAILLLTDDDPHRYDPAKPSSDVGRRLLPLPWTAPGGAGLSLVGAY